MTNEIDQKEINQDLPDIYAPEFVPFYIGIQRKYNLSDLETKIYGFVRYYTTSCNEMFYFSNEQLSIIFSKAPGRISKSVGVLIENNLIEAKFEIKANGGTFRKMRVRLVKNDQSDLAKTTIETSQKRLPNNNNIKENNLNDIYIQVLEHWNSKKIIIHKSVTDKVKRSINGRTKEGYELKEILNAIDNYDMILKGDEYFWNYKWTLQDFMQRGFEKFRDLETAKCNYLKKGGFNNGGFVHPNQAEKGKYDDVVER
jgi:hypothetical protein